MSKTKLVFFFILPLSVMIPIGIASGDAPLLQASDLQYQGAFRLPQGTLPGATYGFDYANPGFAYNPARNSLFINNHTYEQKTAEVSIPQIVNSTSLNNLRTATLLQNPFDITEGHLGKIGAGGADTYHPIMGGLMVHGNKLIGTSYEYYDVSGFAQLSHFTSGMTLSATGDFQGMYAVGNVHFTAGFLAPIPQEWQAGLGGTALSGHCCVSGIASTSSGPTATVFNPDDLGVKNPVPQKMVLGYPSDHPTLGTWGGNGSPNPPYNMGTSINGLVFPQGTRSILFFGTTGMGTPCYGCGGSTNPGAECANQWCYDPVDGSKGTHVYPYSSYLWAYDANDFIAVKNGTKNPWDITPYYHGAISLPFDTGANELNGAAYDPATQRIYVAQKCADGNCLPVIHVFKVNITSSGETTPPAAPTHLRTR